MYQVLQQQIEMGFQQVPDEVSTIYSLCLSALTAKFHFQNTKLNSFLKHRIALLEILIPKLNGQ